MTCLSFFLWPEANKHQLCNGENRKPFFVVFTIVAFLSDVLIHSNVNLKCFEELVPNF